MYTETGGSMAESIDLTGMNIPNHIAIIMDGNGRWAKKRFLPRNAGHVAGAKTVEKIIEDAYDLGVKYLTVYAFSTENWNRPDDEVAALMKLLKNYLKDCIKRANSNNLRVRVIGERSRLEPEIVEKIEELEGLSATEKANMLFIVQDPYTSYYDAKVVRDFVALTQKLGFEPTILPFKPNGKAMHIKGFLTRFSKTAKTQAEFLNRVAKLNVPLVGVDPAIVLSYRDEYKEVLGDSRGDFHVLTAHEWLTNQLESNALQSAVKNIAKSDRTFEWHLFPHCTESTFMPNSPKEWQHIFAQFGQTLNVEKVGCCGMAGVFGHEVQNQTISKDIYDVSWGKKLQGKDPNHCLATGYSCRSQVKRYEKAILKHPVQALLEVLNHYNRFSTYNIVENKKRPDFKSDRFFKSQ